MRTPGRFAGFIFCAVAANALAGSDPQRKAEAEATVAPLTGVPAHFKDLQSSAPDGPPRRFHPTEVGLVRARSGEEFTYSDGSLRQSSMDDYKKVVAAAQDVYAKLVDLCNNESCLKVSRCSGAPSPRDACLRSAANLARIYVNSVNLIARPYEHNGRDGESVPAPTFAGEGVLAGVTNTINGSGDIRGGNMCFQWTDYVHAALSDTTPQENACFGINWMGNFTPEKVAHHYNVVGLASFTPPATPAQRAAAQSCAVVFDPWRSNGQPTVYPTNNGFHELNFFYEPDRPDGRARVPKEYFWIENQWRQRTVGRAYDYGATKADGSLLPGWGYPNKGFRHRGYYAVPPPVPHKFYEWK